MKSELLRFLRGFRYAASGVRAALRAERNLRFHLCAAVYVLLLSCFYDFDRAEYALLFLCIGGVMSLELANSAVERAVDRPDAAHWAAAGLAKDMAAGAVLVFSLAAAAVGVVLFWQPAVLAHIPGWLAGHPAALTLLAASLPCAVCFVLQPKKKG
ncbi:diacylglycerol kinase family protein [Allofournierella sp. CML151]|uniref:diacylglycerol kinase family protein n=1 Tax=Allofournierella sp. CML151 TaxID=2998082 RepID=UPI0022EA67C5|nr:diacylglycerol kinase family protein [Fournierella sp. CML151]